MSNKSFSYYYNKVDNKSTFKLVDQAYKKLNSYDIRVSVKAVGLNPVDYKVASGVHAKNPVEKILGFDASGIVLEVGADVKRFKIGDEVFYAGDIKRAGSFAQEQVVDSRIVGKKSEKLSFLESAALPLTSITAWEGLFEVLNVVKDSKKTILVIGGAGGVGSMVIQLTKALTSLRVIATASREESAQRVKSLGADDIVNYKNGLEKELKSLGVDEVDYVFCTQNTEAYFDTFSKIVKPFGKIVSIVEVSNKLNLNSLKNKSISFGWEFMFAKSMYQTNDMDSQGEILDRISALVSAGQVKTTMSKNIGILSKENLEEGFRIVEEGKTIGKIVLKGISNEN